ncbi:glycosyltransferase [Flavobacterium sp.]|uniref:glycosyltransferase n=1 Tax=Flavobacterium sp. TaxID=239 RepID=UPI003D6C121C
MSKKNNHIVILTPGFPENETDTSCIPALQIYVKELRKLTGYEISVISFHYPKKKSVYNWNGIQVFTLGSSAIISKMLLWNKAYRVLKQIHRDKPITALHSFWLGECALVGHWFSKRNQVLHLTTLMGQDALKGNKYAKILPLKKLKLFVLSPFHQTVFNENYNTKAAIIPWGIHPDSFCHMPKKTIDIISIGSLIPLKNHALFIDIIAKINKTKSIKAVIIGDGMLRKTLEEKIRLLALENTIILKGQLSYDETMQYLAQSKILLHTSNYESFGLVFAEALQSNTMIVSKSIGCATASPNWRIAAHKTEMIEACNNLLSESFSETEENTFLIEKTIQNYLTIYDN